MHRAPIAPTFSGRFSLFTALLCLCGPVLAQTAPPALAPSKPAASASQPAPAPAGRPDQRIEHIRVEDSGARIDELRVGGETQSITVQPKSGMPAYEILPTDGKNSPPALTRDGSPRGAGERVWKVLSF